MGRGEMVIPQQDVHCVILFFSSRVHCEDNVKLSEDRTGRMGAKCRAEIALRPVKVIKGQDMPPMATMCFHFEQKIKKEISCQSLRNRKWKSKFSS